MKDLIWLVVIAVAPGVLAAQSRRTPSVEEFELTSRVFGNTRTIRILLPPSYNETASRERIFPACYFLDGRAAFDDGGWGVVPVAESLWTARRIPEVVIIGIDNGGSTRESRNPYSDRAGEFLPYPDPSWTVSPPVLRGKDHPRFLFTEVIPAVQSRYRVAADSGICLAGDSYAGIAVIYAAEEHPGRIQRLLIESPSLHVGNGRLITEARGVSPWPARVYLGYGTAEGEREEYRMEMVSNSRALAQWIRKDRGTTLKVLEVPGAVHSYDAWRARLPQALAFLLGEEGAQ